MSGHTQGPWRAIAIDHVPRTAGGVPAIPAGLVVVTGRDAARLHVADLRTGHFDGPTTDANARLIAAAPALYANLRFAVWCMENPGMGPTPDALDNMRASLRLADGTEQVEVETPRQRPDRSKVCPGMETGGTAPPCCDRAGEYNGYGSDGPTIFTCPAGCPCHD